MGKIARAAFGEKRAHDLLAYHKSLLENEDRTFYEGKELCFFLQHGSNPDEEEYTKIGYVQGKKLLSRTYNMEIETVVHNMKFPEDFELKIKFTGFPLIQAAYFKAKNKEHRKYEELFNNEILISEIMKYAAKVDLAYLKLQYNEHNSVMTIKAAPYAGALLRLIFPPIFFKIPLKEEEMNAVWEILMVVRECAEQFK